MVRVALVNAEIDSDFVSCIRNSDIAVKSYVDEIGSTSMLRQGDSFLRLVTASDEARYEADWLFRNATLRLQPASLSFSASGGQEARPLT